MEPVVVFSKNDIGALASTLVRLNNGAMGENSRKYSSEHGPVKRISSRGYDINNRVPGIESDCIGRLWVENLDLPCEHCK
jgi:hypothetical protein